jgi:Kae1-associated kinase Bud32
MNPQIGAEARVEFSRDTVTKIRLPKGYRHPDLDRTIRRNRNRREAALLRKVPVRVPTVLATDEFSITMERIEGERLRDRLDDAAAATRYGSALGTMLAALHDADVTHGDLTTSNVLVETASDALVLIDFGLAKETTRIEEKAVDLHVLRETLGGSHPLLADAFWNALDTTYGASGTGRAVLERLTAVERRGRNKVKH